jgi:hypothetical protein
MQLAAEVPAATLADTLGITPRTAVRWAAEAGGNWTTPRVPGLLLLLVVQCASEYIGTRETLARQRKSSEMYQCPRQATGMVGHLRQDAADRARGDPLQLGLRGADLHQHQGHGFFLSRKRSRRF